MQCDPYFHNGSVAALQDPRRKAKPRELYAVILAENPLNLGIAQAHSNE